MRTLPLSSALTKKTKIIATFEKIVDKITFYRDPSVLVFASSSKNDGGRVVAAECAKVLAARGKNVLLIDTDLRRSAAADDGVGLSEYLVGKAQWGDIFCQTDCSRLYAIPGGQTPPNPTDLLSAKSFGSLLAGARSTFDYVLLSTAPLDSYIDGALVAVRCDGAILVLSSRRTKERSAQEAKRLLKKSGCKILGAVLNSTAVAELEPPPEAATEETKAPAAPKKSADVFDEEDEA
ncbi:MAG: CpsD/CapB family tyrosine-protein kinase [Clostridia bacterium]|nr:CpsD/CapB family tyrosine-protein kinase [Clostridia bacterium]